MAIPQRSHSVASGFFERALVSASAAPIAIQGPSANGVAKKEKNAKGGAWEGGAGLPCPTSAAGARCRRSRRARGGRRWTRGRASSRCDRRPAGRCRGRRSRSRSGRDRRISPGRPGPIPASRLRQASPTWRVFSERDEAGRASARGRRSKRAEPEVRAWSRGREGRRGREREGRRRSPRERSWSSAGAISLRRAPPRDVHQAARLRGTAPRATSRPRSRIGSPAGVFPPDWSANTITRSSGESPLPASGVPEGDV